MLFSSISFLYYFLPAVLIIYFISPKKLKNLVLLVASLFFYFYGEPIYTLLMIGSALSGYVHGLLIDRARGTKLAKLPLISSAVISLGLLGFFKYSDFFIENINSIFSSDIALLKLALPIGISFYTFQILSYTIDVYRGDVKVQKNPINFATYVALFPQLIAGPIVRYSAIDEELENRKHTYEDFSYGVFRFAQGLGKKALVANTLAELVSHFNATSEKTVLFYWLSAIAYTLQIYFDFSGYSDMAIGLGRMFGFHFPENFNYPYISKSITEFWRRWHISLGSFFRDYVYIPLGGNRVSKGRWFFNIAVVWFLTGFWHGAAWNFIAWGIYFAIFLLLEKLVLGKLLDKLPSVLRHIYVMFFITLSFVIFNANNLTEAFVNISGMFGGQNVPFASTETLFFLRSYLPVLIFGAVASTPVFKYIFGKLAQNKTGKKLVGVLEVIFIFGVLAVVTAYLVDGSFNPFLYFRF